MKQSRQLSRYVAAAIALEAVACGGVLAVGPSTLPALLEAENDTPRGSGRAGRRPLR